MSGPNRELVASYLRDLADRVEEADGDLIELRVTWARWRQQFEARERIQGGNLVPFWGVSLAPKPPEAGPAAPASPAQTWCTCTEPVDDHGSEGNCWKCGHPRKGATKVPRRW